ncbi:hypothetical protein EV426DRAFT_279165 [Tirmania nivea]|nr:hypothetical protein EV426DRAFT_279165 [Tirmania nivea]
MHLLQLLINSIVFLSVRVVSHPVDSSNKFRSLFRRIESPDNSCGLTEAGNNLGYTCGIASPCCSQHGWCGSDTNYCGAGCQSAYGNCSAITLTNTDDGICGPQNGHKVCSNGSCCSSAGYCGTTEDYCSSPDCQRDFGVCDSDKMPDGVTTLGSPRSFFGSVPYGVDIYDCEEPGTVALTFDDGPFIYTTGLLDILKAHNARATFFVTGVNLGKGRIDDPTLPWAAMIKRMIADGHQVASHSWSHADLSALNDTERTDEMVKNEMALRNIIGKWPTYMRPPYSSCNAACMATMHGLGYHVCYFDLDTEDYLHATPETNYISQQIVHNHLATSEDNWLSIMHDIHEQTVHNLTAYFLSEITAKGFRAVTAGQCLGDPEANWYRSEEPTTSSTVFTTTSTTAISAPVTTIKPTAETASLTPETKTITSNSKPTTTSKTKTTKTSTTKNTTTKTTTTKTTKLMSTTHPSTLTSTCNTTPIGSWCAKPIADFTTQSKCKDAATLCTTDAQRCAAIVGITGQAKCAPYRVSTCDSLMKYCLSDSCSPLSTACTKERWQAS